MKAMKGAGLHACAYTHSHTHIQAYIHTGSQAARQSGIPGIYTGTHIWADTYAVMQSHIYTGVLAYIQPYINTYTYIHTCINTYTHTHIQNHIHTYIQAGRHTHT